MTTILIDGDIVLYEICTGCERATDWGDDIWTYHCDLKEAKQKYDCWIDRVKEEVGASKVIIAMSGSENWRKEVLPSYKLHRKKHRKPMTFKALKEYSNETYRTFQFHNLEADDVLGLLAGEPGIAKVEGERVIVTIDKDLKTIPGLHYNPRKPYEGVCEVSQDQANYNHLFQTLTGDPVDGYSGCPGIGPRRAARVLDYPCWGAVLEAFDGAGLSPEEALVQARVARILRYGEYNTNTKEVNLWNP